MRGICRFYGPIDCTFFLVLRRQGRMSNDIPTWGSTLFTWGCQMQAPASAVVQLSGSPCLLYVDLFQNIWARRVNFPPDLLPPPIGCLSGEGGDGLIWKSFQYLEKCCAVLRAAMMESPGQTQAMWRVTAAAFYVTFVRIPELYERTRPIYLSSAS